MKEVGEMIGVSWSLAEGEEKKKKMGDQVSKESSEDGLNSQLNIKETCEFNEFINDACLVEILTGGSRFTRVSDDEMKFSKLDSFLLNDDFYNIWGNPSIIALDRKLSDHCQIVLKDVDLDFGHKPFIIFNILMNEPDFQHVIEEAWKKEVRSYSSDCIFREKLKNVKTSLRMWSKDRLEKISVEEARILEKEVWDAICGYGGDKSSGTDGFNFKFIRKFWKVIKSDVKRAVMWFWKRMEILRGMAFGCKWCKWVEVCLRSSCISILVNGSTTEEFGIETGVRQGDPLSPFLFILAAKGLNTIVSEAMANGVFRGVKVDVSGLRVNYSKSKLYGIGVDEMELNYMVRLMGCGFSDFPFTYLGIRVGEDMRRVNAWNVVVDRRGEGRDIVRIGEEMDGLGIGFTSSCRGVLGDGRDIRFWTDMWVGDQRLCDRFPRLFYLDSRKEGRAWDKGSEFTVKELARLAEEKVLRVKGGHHETIWNNLVPKKVNIFVWRALRGRLPVRVELDRRAMSVWDKIFSWWKVGRVNAFTIEEIFSYSGNVNIPTSLARVWKAVIWTSGYFI
ncbi:RNA-directed DNA polymerase, eukaryota, reverse transcriptase zinc-binding domain protein [Tanacetum coccineum]